MADASRPLAVITGASSGIGRELAMLAAQRGYDLVLAADTDLAEVEAKTSALGAKIITLQLDLAVASDVAQVISLLQGMKVDVLMANAGHGLGHGFLDQEPREFQHVVDTNISGTLLLIHAVGRQMRAHQAGRILITGSIAGFMPGTFQAVYNGTKAFVDSFSWALRNELKDTGVTVTCLMPGPTDTEFFGRADLMDTAVGMSDSKMSAAEVARIGFDAMLVGDGDVVAGWKNKLQAALANITPAAVLAEQHRKMAEPGSGR